MEATISDEPAGAKIGEAPEPPPAAPSPPDAPVAMPMNRRRVLSLATPIIGENLLQTAVGAVDTLLVARLGAAAVAGVGVGFEFVFFIIAILSAIDVGATVLVSQAIGAGDGRRANAVAKQAIVWGLLLAIPVSIGMFLATPAIISLFGTTPDVAAEAITYLQIIAATSVALFLSFVCGAVLRGAGDGRTPLTAAVIANIVNIGLTYALVLGRFGFPALGVAGSAIGSAVGRALGAAFMLAMLIGGRKALSLRGSWGWRPRFAVARQIFALGVPAATEQVLNSGAFMTLIAVVALIGTPALAAQQIAFSITATALVGQSLGARVPADARAAWMISLRWALAWLTTGGALVFLFADRLIGLFSDDPEVIAAGVSALRALGFALPFWAVWFVSSGSLRGSGDTRTPLLIGSSTMWLAVFLAWVGVDQFGGGLGWVWITFAVTTAPTSLLMWWIFRRRVGDYEAGRRRLEAAGAAFSD